MGRVYLFIVFSFLLPISSALAARVAVVPPPLPLSENKQAVFCDFKLSESKIVYDSIRNKVTVKTKIELDTLHEGFIAFDLVPEPKSVFLDGQKVQAELTDINNKITKLRILNQSAFAGRHLLSIEHEITENIRFADGNVSSAFWMRGRYDRQLLEQYLPTNLEYDQYSTIIYIDFEGREHPQKIFTNGFLTKLDEQHFKIQYSATFNASSHYLHTAPEAQFSELHHDFIKEDGTRLPIVLYAKRDFGPQLQDYLEATLTILKDLQRNFGVYPHPRLLIYAAPDFSGASDYTGALIANKKSLGHALAHQYFGHGLKNASGNSRWIGESIVSWIESNYPRLSSLNFESENFVSTSMHRRTITAPAFDRGADLMAYFDGLIAEATNGEKGLKDCLRSSLSSRSLKVFSTTDFRSDLEKVSGRSFEKDFKNLVYGGGILRRRENFFGGSLERLPKSDHHPLDKDVEDKSTVEKYFSEKLL